jgi:hypothetical protein
MRPLRSLSPAERRRAFDSLIDAAREAAATGWEPWERPEYVLAAARALELALDPSDVTFILGVA